MIQQPLTSTLFPYTTLFRSFQNKNEHLYFETKRSIKRHFKMNQTKQLLIKNLELLVIDEVSMLRADLLDAMNEMLQQDRKSTRLNSSHVRISYAVFCLKKKI